MRQIINIALNQLRIQLSARTSLVTLFVVPIIMTVILGSVNNGPSSLKGAVIDIIRSPDTSDDLSARFVNLLREQGKSEDGKSDRYVICDLSQPYQNSRSCSSKIPDDPMALAAKRLEDGDSVASIVFPATFSSDLHAGKSVSIQMNTKSSPIISQVIQQDLDAVGVRLGGILAAARTVTDKAKGDSAFYDKVFAAAEGVWTKDPIQVEQSYSTLTGTVAGTGFGQSAPGIGAMFTLFNAFLLPQLFVQERLRGTLQRLRMLPLTNAQILTGKMLGQYVLCVITFSLMLATGAVFGVRWGDPLALVVITLEYALAVTALALAASTFIKTNGQAVGISVLIMLILAPLGGAWWPLSITPTWMQTFGKIVSPIAWSQDAFTKMIFYGAKLGDILPSVAVLLIFTAVFFAFGLLRFRYET